MKKSSTKVVSSSANTETVKSPAAGASLLPLAAITALAILGAVSKTTEPVITGGPWNPADVAWMLTASALVLLMTPGLSFFYGGMVRPKNVISTMLQSFVAMGLISLLWVAVGFSLAFGDSIGGIIGDPRTFFMFHHVGGATHPDLSATIPLALFAVFQLKFAIITPALITGSFAERVRFSSYMLFICLWSVFVYAPLAHMTWHPQGLFHSWGVLDFAGGTVVHLSAGVAALAGALVLGQRKVHAAGESHSPANIPFVVLGTGMLWFGWFGFNAGSALAANETAVSAFLTTNTACAAAMLAWLIADVRRGKKPSALGACVGAVVGLVAITPAAGFVSVGASMFIGIVASFICNYAVHLRSKTDIDDTLDVFPCHGLGGIVGMLLTAVFADKVGLIHGETHTLMMHLLALVIAVGYTFIASLVLYKITDLLIPLRVNEEQEELGLDMSQHGEALLEAQDRFLSSQENLFAKEAA
jgi:Amt family ammonium transporter